MERAQCPSERYLSGVYRHRHVRVSFIAITTLLYGFVMFDIAEHCGLLPAGWGR